MIFGAVHAFDLLLVGRVESVLQSGAIRCLTGHSPQSELSDRHVTRLQYLTGEGSHERDLGVFGGPAS
ncbi:MAG: hypothetical protein AB7G13_17605 [Lautropia sp.]